MKLRCLNPKLHLASLVLALLAAPAWCGPAFSVSPQFWEQPRTAAAVLAQPALRQAVSAWLGEADGRLVLHHGNGEEALLRAEELRGWLVALAVDAARIELAGDLPGSEEIRVELIARPSRGKK
ncbi:MAG: hypothetical protein KGZ83_16670 [Sulfuricella sp.]|nr:hypothetical protein [Sulfuricella sp.]